MSDTIALKVPTGVASFLEQPDTIDPVKQLLSCMVFYATDTNGFNEVVFSARLYGIELGLRLSVMDPDTAAKILDQFRANSARTLGGVDFFGSTMNELADNILHTPWVGEVVNAPQELDGQPGVYDEVGSSEGDDEATS